MLYNFGKVNGFSMLCASIFEFCSSSKDIYFNLLMVLLLFFVCFTSLVMCVAPVSTAVDYRTLQISSWTFFRILFFYASS